MTTYANSRGVALERAYQHWRERGAFLKYSGPQSDELPLTIAISRESGAGGSAIAHELADRLGWLLYDRELVEQISDDTGVQSRLLDRLDEKKPNWLAECFEGFSDERNISGVGYAIRLRKVLLALYCHGNCIILGRGAAQVLPEERALRIRLIAPKTTRCERVAKILGSMDDAQRFVNDTDQDRNSFVKSYFHKDPCASDDYDLVLDTSRFSRNGCVNIITNTIEQRRSTIKQGT